MQRTDARNGVQPATEKYDGQRLPGYDNSFAFLWADSVRNSDSISNYTISVSNVAIEGVCHGLGLSTKNRLKSSRNKPVSGAHILYSLEESLPCGTWLYSGSDCGLVCRFPPSCLFVLFGSLMFGLNLTTVGRSPTALYILQYISRVFKETTD